MQRLGPLMRPLDALPPCRCLSPPQASDDLPLLTQGGWWCHGDSKWAELSSHWPGRSAQQLRQRCAKLRFLDRKAERLAEPTAAAPGPPPAVGAAAPEPIIPLQLLPPLATALRLGPAAPAIDSDSDSASRGQGSRLRLSELVPQAYPPAHCGRGGAPAGAPCCWVPAPASCWVALAPPGAVPARAAPAGAAASRSPSLAPLLHSRDPSTHQVNGGGGFTDVRLALHGASYNAHPGGKREEANPTTEDLAGPATARSSAPPAPTTPTLPPPPKATTALPAAPGGGGAASPRKRPLATPADQTRPYAACLGRHRPHTWGPHALAGLPWPTRAGEEDEPAQWGEAPHQAQLQAQQQAQQQAPQQRWWELGWQEGQPSSFPAAAAGSHAQYATEGFPTSFPPSLPFAHVVPAVLLRAPAGLPTATAFALTNATLTAPRTSFPPSFPPSLPPVWLPPSLPRSLLHHTAPALSLGQEDSPSPPAAGWRHTPGHPAHSHGQ
jgi:hypothetical protein